MDKKNLKNAVVEEIYEKAPEPEIPVKPHIEKPKSIVAPLDKSEVAKRWDLSELNVTRHEKPQAELYIPKAFLDYAKENDMFLCWIAKKNYSKAEDVGYVNARSDGVGACPEVHDMILMMMPMSLHDELHKESLRQDAKQTGEWETIQQRKMGNYSFNPHEKTYRI